MSINVVHRARTELGFEEGISHLAIFEGETAHSLSVLTVEETYAGKKQKASIFLTPEQWAELATAAAAQAVREAHASSGDTYMTNAGVLAFVEANQRERAWGSNGHAKTTKA